MVVIALDFDGVLHSYTRGYTGPEPLDPPVEGAVEFCHWLARNGFNPVVVTARIRSGSTATRDWVVVQKWLQRHKFPPMTVTNRKVAAALYIDDRGWRFTGPSCWPVLRALLEAGAAPKTWVGEGFTPLEGFECE